MSPGRSRNNDAGKRCEPDNKRDKSVSNSGAYDSDIDKSNTLEDVEMTDDLQQGPTEKKETQQNVRDKADNAVEENNKIADKFRYGRQERSLFAVYVRIISDQDKTKSIKVIEIARKLANSNVRFDNNVESPKNTWCLTFNTRETANACLSNLNLGKNGLEAIVPAYLHFKKGVVRDTPVDVSLEESCNTLREGTLTENQHGEILLPEGLCKIVSSIDDLIEKIYPGINDISNKDNEWFSERAILCPTNEIVKDFEKEDKTRKVMIGCFTIVRVSYQDERHHEGVGFYEGTFETKRTAFKEVRTKCLVDAMYNTLISFKEIRDYFENLEKKKVERIKRQNELKQQWISNNFDSKKTMINESENTHHLKN
ncbi:hypothetical protein KQX54_010026 [Cotesia glomerata]|uniref:DNA helicase n=1 Tax=Cotesia glomerata TaxID=32391 RepID=A0AAV7HQQ8_COTGL|nr:hypothetical protein KQX54_010026 [Cotesia glomerata]